MLDNSTNSEIAFLLKESVTTIDKYKIIKVLGKGGMGIVYLAHDPQLNRNVALKIIYQKSSTTAQRFLREAKAISMLDHPNIVKIYHLSNTKEGIPYIAMEYIKGQTLDKYLELNPHLSIKQKIQLLIPVLEAIHYAHNKGIIHRDIKPENILIDNHGNPLLTDFGLAKELDVTDETLTKEGIVVGTIGYMSPEQAWNTSGQTDGQTDIYSCGVVLYKMLTDKVPIVAKNIVEFVQHLVEKKIVPPRHYNKNIPLALQSICLKALAKNKKSRYQTAKDFAKDLQLFCRLNNWHSFLRFHYQYTVIFLLLLVCIYWATNVPEPQIKQEPPIDIIARWIQNGFYDKAQQELEKIKPKLPENVYHQYRYLLAAKKHDNLAMQRYYDLLSEKYKYSDIVQLALAENYMAKSMWTLALQALGNVKGELSAFHVPYYTGKIYYHTQKFSQANEQFFLAKLAQAKDDYIDVEIAKCYLKLGLYTKIRDMLTNFPDKNRFPEIYFLLGRSAIGLQQYQQAQHFFEKQLQLIQPQSQSYYWLAKALIYQKKYREASTYLQKARSLEPTNLEIFKEYTSIALYDTDLMKDRYLEFFTDLEKWRYSPQAAVDIEITKIRDKHYDHYFQMKTLSKQLFSKQQVALFIHKLANPAISSQAKKALFLMRYSKHIHLLKQKFARLYKEIVAVRDQEQQSALYYQLASVSLKPSYQHNLSISQIQNIATNKKLATLYRYIAAKTLVHLLKIDLVDNLRQQATANRDTYSEAIYACALRSVNIRLDLTTKKFPYLPDNKLVLLPGFFDFYKLDNKHVQILLEQDSAAAIITALHHYKKEPHHARCLSRIHNVISSNTSQLSSLTAYVFFNSTSYRDLQNSLYKNIWLDFIVRIPVLNEKVSQAALQIAINKELFIPTKIIQQLLEKKLSVPTTMLILNYLAKIKHTKIIEQYYANTTHNPSLRIYAYYKHFTTELLAKYRGVKPTIFIKEKDDFMRSYAYIMNAYLGEEILHFIEKESTHMQAFLLKISAFPVLPIVGKNNAKLPTDVRYAIMRKYQKHPNDYVRKHAYNAEIYVRYGSENIDSFIEECIEKKDMIVRKGVANAIRERLVANIEIHDRNFIEQLLFFTQKYHPQATLHIDRYFKNALSKNMALYKKMLLQIHKLDKWNAADFYRNAIILNMEGKKKEAIRYLKTAIEMDNNILYNIELAKLAHAEQQDLEEVLADIYKLNQQRIYPDYHRPLLKMGKKDLIEKIFLANYIQQSYAGSHLKARFRALQNLITYYRNTQDNDKLQFYMTVLRHQKILAPKNY